MANEDIHVRRFTIDEVFLDADGKEISEDRVNEYRQLLDSLQIKDGFHRYNSRSVAFIASTGNKSIFGRSYKAFLYSTEPQAPIVDSIDKYVSFSKHDPVYKRLGDNWYLVYEAW
jgi:hypothetical protein